MVDSGLPEQSIGVVWRAVEGRRPIYRSSETQARTATHKLLGLRTLLIVPGHDGPLFVGGGVGGWQLVADRWNRISTERTGSYRVYLYLQKKKKKHNR